MHYLEYPLHLCNLGDKGRGDDRSRVMSGNGEYNFPCSDGELNVCTRMPHQRVLDRFKSAIFPEPPATSGTCSGTLYVIIDYRDYVYGIGNALISRNTPPNTGHNVYTLVYRGHEGAKNFIKNGGYGQLLVLCFSSKTKIAAYSLPHAKLQALYLSYV